MNMMAMADVMSKYQQQQHQQQQQQRQQQHNLQPQQQHATQKGLEGLLLTNTNTSNNNSSSSSSSSISNLIISHNSASNTGNKMQPTWGQSDAISALWGCSSSSSGCSSGSGSQPSLSPTASSNGNDGSKMMLWAAQSSPQNAATLRDGFKELQRQQPPQQQVPQQLPHAASPTASLTSSSSSSNGWSASHYGKPNIWELPGSTGQRTPASSHDIFTDLLCNLSISQDNSSQQASSKADASDVSSNSSSSAGELLEAANIWRFPEYASSQLYMEEPTGGAAACMQLFNDYLNMN
uniref:AT22129p n=1 Tax=Drosophila melanogaster TaxID=7227 RepID=Q6NLK5_DROME|nr:AT22129p [Drosophila melanogaster]